MVVTRRGVADVVAAIVAVVVAVVGITLIVKDSHVLAPKSTTTVTKNAVGGVSPTHKTTTVVTRRRGDTTSRTTTRERIPGVPRQPKTVTVTTQTGERTFVERVLGDAGLVVLQVGVVLLAAFLSAAMVQRVIVGQFGGLEFGSFKLAEIVTTSSAALDTLREKVDKLWARAATKKALKAVDEARQDDRARVTQTLAQVTDNLAIAYKRIDLIEKRLPE